MPMTRDLFARQDPTDDARFYAVERKVVHIEPGAIAALGAAYAELLPLDAPLLDLMSSWRSHLPRTVLGPVTGLGMNRAEMADNPRLDDLVLHDLNLDPGLPFADDAFGGVVCAVSVQYLTRPVEVFREVARVTRPGGPVVVSFSNRCFPTKAVAAWLLGGDREHRALVRGYMTDAGLVDVVDERLPSPDDPLFLVRGRAGPPG